MSLGSFFDIIKLYSSIWKKHESAWKEFQKMELNSKDETAEVETVDEIEKLLNS